MSPSDPQRPQDPDRPWGLLPAIDPDPDAPMCGTVNGKIICCRSQGHEGRHATPFPSFRRHGPVWVYWGGPPLGPFGTCHENDPATHLYCGLERGHEGDHLSPSNQGPGATLAEWGSAPASPLSAPATTAPETETARAPAPDRFDCLVCGIGVKADEDGCCATCGLDCVVFRAGVPTYPHYDWTEIAHDAPRASSPSAPSARAAPGVKGLALDVSPEWVARPVPTAAPPAIVREAKGVVEDPHGPGRSVLLCLSCGAMPPHSGSEAICPACAPSPRDEGDEALVDAALVAAQEIGAAGGEIGNGHPARTALLDHVRSIRRRAIEEAAGVADGWAAQYPEDVFTDGAGKMGRHVSRMIARDLRALAAKDGDGR